MFTLMLNNKKLGPVREGLPPKNVPVIQKKRKQQQQNSNRNSNNKKTPRGKKTPRNNNSNKRRRRQIQLHGTELTILPDAIQGST